ncbi:hypothetical protein J2R99_000839 [Rhodopseudomonas julia]|uniref:Uncharacterized protein n=1 Tax=Rhodopseudomonas julia TaxID=200617 RepID=A0ABU0C398_9BRAD|nr:hypothetical protein [Rhodopseudomonas julia]MDQ0324990.1 hypothetical protein [Rhodopseudomonas julia]
MGDLAKLKYAAAGGAGRSRSSREGPGAETRARRPRGLVVSLPGVDLQTVMETVELLRSLDGQPGLDPFNRAKCEPEPARS